MTGAPERKHVLISNIQADSERDLANAMHRMALQIERGELTTGCSGGPTDGSIYSYKITPEQTHDAYFNQVDEWLRQKKEARP